MNIRLLALLLPAVCFTAYAGDKGKKQIKSDKKVTLSDGNTLYHGHVMYTRDRDTVSSDSLLVHQHTGQMTFTGNVNMKTYKVTKTTTSMTTDKLVIEKED